MNEVFGQQDVTTTDNEFNTLSFVFWLLMQKVQTATLVQVISCTNNGGLSPVGRVTVQPCVNQMTGNRQAVAHGQIFNCLYSRITGGDNAIIMDPQPGDLGLMVFCSRDISGVIANEGPANPGSFRMFDWADGIFTMNVPLGKTPSQYIRFSDTDGIVVSSPTTITLQAPTVNINATGSANISSAAINLAGPITQTTGGTAVLEAVTATSVTAPTITSNTTVLHTHDHSAGTYNVSGTAVTGNSGNPI